MVGFRTSTQPTIFQNCVSPIDLSFAIFTIPMLKKYLNKSYNKKLLSQINITHTLPSNIKGNLMVEQAVCLQNSKFVDDCKVGFLSYLGSDCEVRKAEIGRYCSIGKNVNIGLYNHPLNFLTTHTISFLGNIDLPDDGIFQKFKQNNDFSFNNPPAKIGNDVWIGHNAIIKSGICINTGAIIGAGAVVTKDVPAYAIVGGNPAKIIKYRFDDETIQQLLASKWWDFDLSEILANGGKYADISSILSILQAHDIPLLSPKIYQVQFNRKTQKLNIQSL